MNTSNCQVDQIRIRYRSVGSSSQTKTMGVPVGSGCNTSNISKTVLNLSPSTFYEYELRYGIVTLVLLITLDTFFTKDSCVNMINVSVNTLSSTKVEVCWDSVYAILLFVLSTG